MTKLYWRASEKDKPMELQDALNQCEEALPEAIAILYAPGWCKFAKAGKEDGRVVLKGPYGEIIALEEVFEARVFNKDAELRWLKESPGKGRAVLLWDDDAFKEGDLERFPEKADIKVFDTKCQTYLLWGEGAEPPSGKDCSGKGWDEKNWSLLAMARIGPLPVPFPNVSERKQRIRLVAREYIAEIEGDKYGNVAVIEERLMKLEGVKDEG